MMSVWTYTTFAFDISKSVVVICAGRPLELHVSDVVACFDNDPSMQVYFESTHTSQICTISDKIFENNTHIFLCSASS